MRSQISIEFVITFSLFILLIFILFFSMFSKINEYNQIEDKQEMLEKCKNFGDFLAINLSFKLNELNISAVKKYISSTPVYFLEWKYRGEIYEIGNPNVSFSVHRFYIINNTILDVEVGCK